MNSVRALPGRLCSLLGRIWDLREGRRIQHFSRLKCNQPRVPGRPFFAPGNENSNWEVETTVRAAIRSLFAPGNEKLKREVETTVRAHGARPVVSTSRFNFSFPGAKRGLLGLERSFPLPISNSRFRGQKEACWTSRTVVSTSYFEFSFPGAKKGLPEGSLWEIVISLSCEQNSARKFQSGVSNSGFQIPKHARQNSEVTENSCFTLQKPMERPQNSSRRFLDSCFCFRVPFRGWNLGRFPFPISRFSVQIQGR